MNGLAEDPAQRRRVFLGGTVAATAGTLLVTVILTVLALTARADLANRMAEVAVVFTGATLLLAVVAAVVALLAYAVSTGAPDLQISVTFPSVRVNNPLFEASRRDSSGFFTLNYWPIPDASIQLHNHSIYSARSPAIIIRAVGLGFANDDSPWISIDSALTFVSQELISTTAVQWDGGVPIHGHSTRLLPTLEMRDLQPIEPDGPYELIFEIFAEGYWRKITMPVNIVNEDGDSYNPVAADIDNPAWM